MVYIGQDRFICVVFFVCLIILMWSLAHAMYLQNFLASILQTCTSLLDVDRGLNHSAWIGFFPIESVNW